MLLPMSDIENGVLCYDIVGESNVLDCAFQYIQNCNNLEYLGVGFTVDCERSGGWYWYTWNGDESCGFYATPYFENRCYMPISNFMNNSYDEVTEAKIDIPELFRSEESFHVSDFTDWIIKTVMRFHRASIQKLSYQSFVQTINQS